MDLMNSSDFEKIINISKNNSNTIALILFGSYAKGTHKKNSDIDLCIIRKKDTMPHDFKELDYCDENFDILFFDKLPDYIKFRVISEGKILVLNDIYAYQNIRRNFLHSFRDQYEFYEKNINKVLNYV